MCEAAASLSDGNYDVDPWNMCLISTDSLQPVGVIGFPMESPFYTEFQVQSCI